MSIILCSRSANIRTIPSQKIFLKAYQRAIFYLYKFMTSSQVSTALRPFFFLVHPDFFARYPRAQHVNDANLKVLNNHLDSLVNKVKKKPLDLQFYIKSSFAEDPLKLKNIKLSSSSTKLTVQTILSSFKLPTNYVDKLQESKTDNFNTNTSGKNGNLYYADHFEEYMDFPETKDNLYSWLLKNMGKAEKRLNKSQLIRKDIRQLRDRLIHNINVDDITWERGIGTTHLRGCLQGLEALVTYYPDTKYIIQGRRIHFANETGLSLNGSVVLSTSEVRDQWHRMISRIPSSNLNIEKIPHMQKAVSISLRDIKVTHRKYQPFLLAESYSVNLRRLVTSLGDFLGKSGFPQHWPESLTHLQLVVESAAGPLMLSPTGQILAPSSCPPWLLVNFISENMHDASRLLQAYESTNVLEKELRVECAQVLSLSFLDKDDSISPDLMIECLKKLLCNSYRLAPLLSGARLWVTQYYSVMLDGEVCIPWDWQ